MRITTDTPIITLEGDEEIILRTRNGFVTVRNSVNPDDDSDWLYLTTGNAIRVHADGTVGDDVTGAMVEVVPVFTPDNHERMAALNRAISERRAAMTGA